MSLDPITAALEIGSKVIDKIFPDKTQADAAKAKLLEMQQTGELQLALGQQAINQTEAASSSLFVAGWRPAVGWVCVIGLLYTFLLRPLLAWGSGIWLFPAPPPLDMGDLFTLLAGMLGLGGMRTFEKAKGVAR